MADRQPVDPLRVYKFKLEVGSITQAQFREISGLDSTQDSIEYREGPDGLTVRKMPGLNKYTDITLKRGLTDNKELWDWRKKAMDGKVERQNGSIVLFNDAGEESARWNFVEGWPKDWKGPGLNATGNEVAIESLVIAHEGLERVK